MGAESDVKDFQDEIKRYNSDQADLGKLSKDKRRYRRQNNFLAFIIPVLVLALSYALQMVFPFGDRHMLTVDLFHQYAPFLTLLRRTILSGSSLFYTFSGGLGMNLYALFAYYLASPFNILLLLFPEAYIAEAVFVITLLKLGLAAFAFHLFLRDTFQRNDAFSVIFASMYALSAYVMAYSWNIMWLDALILLPLVLWALTRFIRHGKHILYIVFLSLLLMSNFYVAFFACIFIALYFPIIMSRYSPKKQGRSWFAITMQVVFATAIAVGISAILLWPTVEALQLTSASGDHFPQTVDLYANPLAYLSQHFLLLEPSIRSGYPNLYSGVSILFLIPIFFMSRRFRLRDKILHLLLMIFLLLSFDVNVLNFLWHGMHFPNQLPFRNSFVYIFLVLSMAYAALVALREYKGKEIGILALILILAVPTSALLAEDLVNSKWTVWLTIIFLLLYAFIFSALSRSAHRRSKATVALAIVLLVEVVLSSIVGVYYVGRNEYFGLRDGYSSGSKPAAIRAALKDIEDNYQGDFYRVEINKQKTSNDPALYGYNGLTMFASTAPEKPVKFMENMGYYSNGINSYKYTGSTILLDSIFDIEFLLARDPISYDETIREEILDNGEVQVYQNPYALPLGFMANKAILTYNSDPGNVFTNQNRLVKHINPQMDNIFTPVRITNMDLPPDVADESIGANFHFYKTHENESYVMHLTAEIEDEATHYLYMDNQRHKIRSAVLTDDKNHSITLNKNGLTELGNLERGEVSIEITVSEESSASGDIYLRLASLNEDNFKEFYNKTKDNALSLQKIKNGHFEAAIEAKEDGLLLLSIPYDPSWSCQVDGEESSIETIDGCLMAIPLDAGQHNIAMKFLPQGFKLGLIISIVSLLVLIVLTIVLSLYRKNKAKPSAGEIIASDIYLQDQTEPLDDTTKSKSEYKDDDTKYEEILKESAELRSQRDASGISAKINKNDKKVTVSEQDLEQYKPKGEKDIREDK